MIHKMMQLIAMLYSISCPQRLVTLLADAQILFSYVA